ncbi:NAD kinase 2, chloroplastic isoform X1 [Nicotiana tabacum]|uniref:NAD(+) kinase n=3 Tax=Nicotiana tabacum TaxID=4097 RepID=A0A1S4B8J1_TOBAC|nr:PREDICTED: NAD kinase 2, chloroplastic-like isoform X1 [Nicotiana tabacum]
MAAYCPCKFDMGRKVAGGPIHFQDCQLRYVKISGFGIGFSYGYRRGRLRWVQRRRQKKLVVGAELSSAFSSNVGFDSQPRDILKLPWIGPLPGDIAEIEAYCRILRAAEQLHNTLMETLCNPVSGECSISYDVPSEDKHLLEDRIVSVLGCMVCLLNKGSEDVLSGRSFIINSFSDFDVHVMDDKLPPLAFFRGEMKRYCESLHVALENFITPDDPTSINVWRKLQRLKNVCYDSGFPRGDDHPHHTLLANWNPVYFSSEEETQSASSEVAFWTGGQVTEEGLRWLLERGFKTIIDLRAETIKDNFYEKVLDEAISSGDIEVLKLPVEVGTTPSVQQVEKFAALVSDVYKRPIYLHSKEGVWRTSAMVSRWRQYMTRYTPLFVPNANKDVTSSVNSFCGSRGTQEAGTPVNSEENKTSTCEGMSASDHKNGTLPARSNSINSAGKLFKQIPEAREHKGLSKNEADDTVAVTWKGTLLTADGKTNPLKSQLPPPKFFSRTEMSTYFRSRKVSPETYFTHEKKRLEGLHASRYYYKRIPKGNAIIDSYTEDRAIDSRNPNGPPSNMGLSTKPSNSSANMEKYGGHNGSAAPILNRFNNGEVHTSVKSSSLIDASNELDTNAVSSATAIERRNIEAPRPSVDDNMELIEGNMCASATGVVRLQSRRKAEMFLVRTDGFLCNREKVTETSLAFTHPSTQQQMLLWKSTPKTVLLLKKLGQELMEEAKEVASFLYYQEKMNVLVEPEVHDIFARTPGFGFVQTFYSQDTSDLHESVDFVACLGGDGVILHASKLFRGAIPPVVSFNLGSLGFLTSHTFEDYKKDLRQVIHGNSTLDGVYITLRMRLRCEIFRNGKAMPGKVFDVLNEVVVDRGSNPYLSKIECYEHDRLITKVQADGIIVATPTGSTAYSTAAGGSMVHPNVPCMLFTPICPHSLSFRPVILPDSAKLELKIPEDARNNAWVSFDGKRRQQLSRGDSIRICMSQHPLPTVNKCDQTGDWFGSLIRCLNWNERLDQKAL